MILLAFSAGGREAMVNMFVVWISDSLPRYGWPGMIWHNSDGIQTGSLTEPILPVS